MTGFATHFKVIARELKFLLASIDTSRFHSGFLSSLMYKHSLCTGSGKSCHQQVSLLGPLSARLSSIIEFYFSNLIKN